MNRKGTSIDMLPALAITFTIGFIVLAFGSKITSDIATTLNSTSTGTNTDGYTAANYGTSALLKIGGYAPTLGTVVAGAIVIGILVAAFHRGE